MGRRLQLASVTRLIYVSTQIAALIWVSLSYVMALYATVVLQQPFPVEDLSKTAVEILLGNGALKTISNIFEHNDGVVFGTTHRESEEDNE